MVKGKDEQKAVGAVLREVEPTDLVKFGLIPEFIGRLPMIATLDELDKPFGAHPDRATQFVKSASVSKLFEMKALNLEFRPQGLGCGGNLAMERKTGARGLRSIMEGALFKTMYELPSQEGLIKRLSRKTLLSVRPNLCWCTKHRVE